MIKVSAKDLKEAIIIATQKLSCSVCDLEYEVVQNPSNGFLGFGKKEAIIIASAKTSTTTKGENKEFNNGKTEEQKEKELKIEKREIHKKPSHQEPLSVRDTNKILIEIQETITKLFSKLSYEISTIEVTLLDDESVFVFIDGKDSALLIGEKGYRYKALNYLLSNYTNSVYGMHIKLEIASFLKNQEEMIDAYLQSIIDEINKTGRSKTKPLDGVLAYIALNKLRSLFPNKYISFRLNENNEKYVVINDFSK